jgi:hypothetical protein
MLSEGPHVFHNEFGIFENLSIDPLQHELSFFRQG